MKQTLQSNTNEEKLNNLWKEFIDLLEITEESDSGNKFRPNYIGSCRALDGQRMNQIIKEAKELIVSTPSEITFNRSSREVLRITSDGYIVAGEGLSKEEATQETVKLLMAAFEKQIQEMVDKRCEQLETELAASIAEASLHNLSLDLLTANHMIKLERDRADTLQTRLNEIDAMLNSPETF